MTNYDNKLLVFVCFYFFATIYNQSIWSLKRGILKGKQTDTFILTENQLIRIIKLGLQKWSCNINDIFFLKCFYALFSLKCICRKLGFILYMYHTRIVVHYNFVEFKCKVGGAYSKVQHAGLNIVPYLKMPII